jgi:hypothetical protein
MEQTMTKIEQILNDKLIKLGFKTQEIEHTIDKLHFQRITLYEQLEELAITEQVYEQDLRLVTAQSEVLESLCSEIEYENEQAATAKEKTDSHLEYVHKEIAETLARARNIPRYSNVDEKGNNKSEGFNAESHLAHPLTHLPWVQVDSNGQMSWPTSSCQHDCKCCDHFPDPPVVPTSCAGCFHAYESACPGKTTPCSQFEQYHDEADYKTICDECRLAYTGDCDDVDLCVSDCINFLSVNDGFEEQEDSAIQTAEDLANTIAEEDKPKSLVLAQLVMFSDDDVEDAICSAIGEYAASCPQSHFSRFYVRAFIDHLENNLGNNCDVDYETAVMALEMNKGVTKVYESVWERLN